MILELKNVGLSFQESSGPILQSINLKVQEGEFLAIIGCNGSGKSSLMKIISGEYCQTNGQVLINSKSIEDKVRNAMISHLTQDISISTIGNMTVLENIVLCMIKDQNATFNTYNQYTEAITKALASMNTGIEKFISQSMSSLSGGQRQMIATFMSLTSCKKIILLDEHTSALDPKTQKILMEYTSKLIKEKKLTALMVTHKLDDAIKYGDRILMLHKGQIVEDFNSSSKARLTTDKLLTLFHKYEDQTLRAEND